MLSYTLIKLRNEITEKNIELVTEDFIKKSSDEVVTETKLELIKLNYRQIYMILIRYPDYIKHSARVYMKEYSTRKYVFLNNALLLCKLYDNSKKGVLQALIEAIEKSDYYRLTYVPIYSEIYQFMNWNYSSVFEYAKDKHNINILENIERASYRAAEEEIYDKYKGEYDEEQVDEIIESRKNEIYDKMYKETLEMIDTYLSDAQKSLARKVIESQWVLCLENDNETPTNRYQKSMIKYTLFHIFNDTQNSKVLERVIINISMAAKNYILPVKIQEMYIEDAESKISVYLDFYIRKLNPEFYMKFNLEEGDVSLYLDYKILFVLLELRYIFYVIYCVIIIHNILKSKEVISNVSSIMFPSMFL